MFYQVFRSLSLSSSQFDFVLCNLNLFSFFYIQTSYVKQIINACMPIYYLFLLLNGEDFQQSINQYIIELICKIIGYVADDSSYQIKNLVSNELQLE